MAVQTQQTRQQMFIADPGGLALFIALSVAYVVIGGATWAAGGYFTLTALREFLAPWGVTLAPTQPAAWLIPATVSVVEIGAWKLRGRIPLAGWFLVALVVGFDLASTFYGIIIGIAGLEVHLGTGFRIPDAYDGQGKVNGWPLGIAGGASLALTFVPEALIFHGLKQLVAVFGDLKKVVKP